MSLRVHLCIIAALLTAGCGGASGEPISPDNHRVGRILAIGLDEGEGLAILSVGDRGYELRSRSRDRGGWMLLTAPSCPHEAGAACFVSLESTSRGLAAWTTPGAVHVERWDGKAWHPLSPAQGQLSAVVTGAVSVGDSVHLAITATYAPHQAGTSWVLAHDGQRWRRLETRGEEALISFASAPEGGLFRLDHLQHRAEVTDSLELYRWTGDGWVHVARVLDRRRIVDRPALFADGASSARVIITESLGGTNAQATFALSALAVSARGGVREERLTSEAHHVVSVRRAPDGSPVALVRGRAAPSVEVYRYGPGGAERLLATGTDGEQTYLMPSALGVGPAGFAAGWTLTQHLGLLGGVRVHAYVERRAW